MKVSSALKKSSRYRSRSLSASSSDSYSSGEFLIHQKFVTLMYLMYLKHCLSILIVVNLSRFYNLNLNLFHKKHLTTIRQLPITLVFDNTSHNFSLRRGKKVIILWSDTLLIELVNDTVKWHRGFDSSLTCKHTVCCRRMLEVSLLSMIYKACWTYSFTFKRRRDDETVKEKMKEKKNPYTIDMMFTWIEVSVSVERRMMKHRRRSSAFCTRFI